MLVFTKIGIWNYIHLNYIINNSDIALTFPSFSSLHLPTQFYNPVCLDVILLTSQLGQFPPDYPLILTA